MPGKGTEEVKEVTIIFNSNDESNTTKQITVEKDKDTELSRNIFTRDGYEFLGWSTSADGTEAEILDGATVNYSEDITLYAIWKREGTKYYTWQKWKAETKKNWELVRRPEKDSTHGFDDNKISVGYNPYLPTINEDGKFTYDSSGTNTRPASMNGKWSWVSETAAVKWVEISPGNRYKRFNKEYYEIGFSGYELLNKIELEDTVKSQSREDYLDDGTDEEGYWYIYNGEQWFK